MRLSSITACIPFAPISAADVLTPRSPPSFVIEVQPEKLPDSKLSAKIKSESGEEVGVFAGVGVFVKVGVEVAVPIGVGEFTGVWV